MKEEIIYARIPAEIKRDIKFVSSYFPLIYVEKQHSLSPKVIHPAGESRLTKQLFVPDPYSTIFKT